MFKALAMLICQDLEWISSFLVSRSADAFSPLSFHALTIKGYCSPTLREELSMWAKQYKDTHLKNEIEF